MFTVEFPLFQFKDGVVIEAYAELLPLFHVSNSTATSFMMTGYVLRDNEEVAYYEAMKDISEEEFDFIKRDVELFGIHIAS